MYSVTSKGMKLIDEYTMSKGISSEVLMENAARAVLDEIMARFPDRKTKILVLAGTGNNGGDAICLARWLLHKKYDASLYFIGDPSSVSEGFKKQVSIFNSAFNDAPIYGVKQVDTDVLYAHYDVIVDGIFGIGLNKELNSSYIRYIEYFNSKKGYKIAIDIPSGLNASYGESMGAVFEADLTVTFGAYKNGMFMAEGRNVCGEVVVADIGILEAGIKSLDSSLTVCDRAFYEGRQGTVLLPRTETSHKGTYGTVGIVVSSDGMLGASMLAAKAAYRTGCGLVKIFCPQKYIGFFNVSVPEAVVVPYKNDDVVGALGPFVDGTDCVLIGPGLREGTTERIIIKQILATEINVVFDAGALNIISRNLKSFKKRKCNCVITPHIGEMARLIGEDISVVERKRVAFTRQFSKKFNVSMVVKSDVSILSLINKRGNQDMYICTIGNSGLATAGSGDVQSGVIASLVAQGNSLNNSLLYGTMIHGMAAERYATDDDSKRKMMAGDIIDNLF